MGLGMGHQQHHRAQEDDAAQHKFLLISNGFARVGIMYRQPGIGRRAGRQLLAVSQRIKHHAHHQGDAGNNAGIGDKIGKAVTQRSPNDDIGRVAAHGGGATQVRAENFRQHHRHRVKFQQLRKLDRYRRQEQNDGDTIDKHGQYGAHHHKGNKNRHYLIFYRFGYG